jgi:hypothetical protein
MFTVQFPDYPHQIKQRNTKKYIFDIIRKKWLLFTPEEWVRQNILHYLISEKKIPIQRIAVEKEITTFEKKKRFDIVVYDADFKPFIIVECKSQHVMLNTLVLDQILNYNSVLQSKFIIISNGDFFMVWDCINSTELDFIPNY